MKALLAASLLIFGSTSWLQLPASVEKWLFNPRERTQEGLEALEEGDADAAVSALDAAARLRGPAYRCSPMRALRA